MKLATYFATSALLVTLAMFVSAGPRFQRRLTGLQSKFVKETMMAFSTRDATSKERQPDKGWVLGKLLGLEKEDSSEKKQRPTPSITVFTSPSDSPRSDANEYAYTHSGRGANETDQQEVKGRRRVRRYCSAGHWRCHRPTKKPHRKQKSPKKAHH